MKKRISAGKMLHDSKFAPKIGIVRYNLSFHPWSFIFLAGFCGTGVRTVGREVWQRAQGLPIAIVEEIAFENGWITLTGLFWRGIRSDVAVYLYIFRLNFDNKAKKES